MSDLGWDVPEPRGGTGDEPLAEPIGGVLRRQARVHGKRPAVLWEAGGEPRQLTYAQLAMHANAVAHRLSDLSPGDRVAVWGTRSVERILVGYACALRGLVLVPLDPAWTDAEAVAALELARPSWVFTGADARGVPLADRARLLADAAGVRPLDGLLDWTEAPPSWGRASPDAPVLLEVTFGPGGEPAGTLLSHRAVLGDPARHRVEEALTRGEAVTIGEALEHSVRP